MRYEQYREVLLHVFRFERIFFRLVPWQLRIQGSTSLAANLPLTRPVYTNERSGSICLISLSIQSETGNHTVVCSSQHGLQNVVRGCIHNP